LAGVCAAAGGALAQDATLVTGAGQAEAPLTARPTTVRQPATTPGAAGGRAIDSSHAEIPNGDELVTLSAFSEPLEMSALVDYVVQTLKINVRISGTLTGSVVFNAPVQLQKRQLLDLLLVQLEQNGFTMTQDRLGFYAIAPVGSAPMTVRGEYATTRIIPTPNVRPSSLQLAIQGLGVAGAPTINYVDELGLLVVTGSPNGIRAVEDLVSELLQIYRDQTFTRIDLHHVAAPAARDRVLQLVGQAPQTPTTTGRGGRLEGGQPAAAAGPTIAVDRLGERLTIDPAGNALIFRGFEDELVQVRSVIEVIDVASTLPPKGYYAGGRAKEIADIARQRGLGEVIEIGQDDQSSRFGFPQSPNAFLSQSQTAGGPLLVVDVENGTIVYYGTNDQQAVLAALISELDTESDRVVIQEYKIRHADAQEVADIVQGLIENRTLGGDSPLLPGGTSSRNRNRTTTPPTQQGGPDSEGARPADESGGDEAGFNVDAEKVFVMADVANNQVLVKAPIKQQKDFAKLIEKLDLRRPQVYIDVQIVTVSKTDGFRLAVETQLINAMGKGGLVQTDFGLTEPGAGGVTSPREVIPSLGGLTSALILSDYVPFVINAIQRNTDARIVANPQLLVNDNEEAEITSVEQQPTTVTQTGQTTDSTGFGGYEDAGTSLIVTPSISEGGYLRLQYEITQSNFIGSGTNGIPPPKQDRTIRSEGATIPADTTIVVGGITITDTRDTVVKVPLLGDIPLAGLLFRDTQKMDNESVLYVFITPRILRDPNFADLRLIAMGPQADVDMPDDVPELTPSVIPVLELPRPRNGSAESATDAAAEPTGAEESHADTSASALRTSEPAPGAGRPAVVDIPSASGTSHADAAGDDRAGS
jgi:type II secretory pathway component GspD/PulD (secretin)